MRIGLDIDNVITAFDDSILKEFLTEDKKKRNSGIINKEASHIVKGMFDWSQEETDDFFAKNMERIAIDLKPREDCKLYMDRLLEDGHELFLISHRVYPHYNHPEQTTLNWLEKNHINYTKLILSESPDKSAECKKYNIDIMIDDRIGCCKKMRANGVCCILMLTDFNKKETVDLPFATGWANLYEKIRQMTKLNVILDTDISNEIDDQFALTYLIKHSDRFNLEAITLAPFCKSGYSDVQTVKEGTELSYKTTLKLLDMLDMPDYKGRVYKGALNYFFESKETNPAINKMMEVIEKNKNTTIIAIGAITNVALLLDKRPDLISKINVVWLGGNSFLSGQNREFNFRQDIEAVRTVFESQVNLTVIPCRNVASNLITTRYELEHYLKGRGKLEDYLCDIFKTCKKDFNKTKLDEVGSSKTIWDISAVAYLVNKEWFIEEQVSCPIILKDGKYKQTKGRHSVTFINDLYRNKIFKDFFLKMGATGEEQ